MSGKQYLAEYRANGFDNVEGWCGHNLFDVVELLDGADINKTGGCLEIGVHHGKFFILLNCVIEPEFKSYALDVFENQSLNIDKSGRGNLEMFKINLGKYDRHKGANTQFVAGDSTDLNVIKSFDDKLSSFRFVSIDGGHTAAHTVSDLKLSNKLIANEGVVILDDILNVHWLGVLQGALAFLEQKPTLVPIAIGHNKLLFSKLSFQPFYFDLFNKSILKRKVVDFFGHSIVAL